MIDLDDGVTASAQRGEERLPGLPGFGEAAGGHGKRGPDVLPQPLQRREVATPRWLGHHLAVPTTTTVAAVRAMVADGILIPIDEHARGRVLEGTAVTMTDPQRTARAA